jgi:hypothetical protein
MRVVPPYRTTHKKEQSLMARPEHRFSKDLVKALEAQGCYVIPIETGPTQRGVPDLYIAKRRVHDFTQQMWVELKIVSPKQEKEPRSAIQIKRQKEMQAAGLRVLNAHDVRDSKDLNIEYRLSTLTPHEKILTIHDLASAIINLLEN